MLVPPLGWSDIRRGRWSQCQSQGCPVEAGTTEKARPWQEMSPCPAPHPQVQAGWTLSGAVVPALLLNFYLLPGVLICQKEHEPGGFPGGAVVRNPPANAGDAGLSSGPGRYHMPRSNYVREPQLLKPCT